MFKKYVKQFFCHHHWVFLTNYSWYTPSSQEDTEVEIHQCNKCNSLRQRKIA
jgi:hypothetical protein